VTLIERVEAKAYRHKGWRYLAYADIEASGLPVEAVFAALLYQGWTPDSASNSLKKKIEEPCPAP
jgi:hypothetical protein